MMEMQAIWETLDRKGRRSMNVKKLIRALPKGFKFQQPKSAEEWNRLEKATLEVLKKVKREKQLERLNKELYRHTM